MLKNRKTFLIVYTFAFLWVLSGSLPTYIQSSFLEQFVSVQMVGVYTGIATFTALIVIFLFSHIIKKYSNYWVTFWLLLILIISSVALGYLRGPWFILLFFVANYLSWNLISITVDVFLSNISDTKRAGRIRTTFLTITNVAWLISPFLMGIIAEGERYSLVYLSTVVFLVPALVIFLLSWKNLRDHTKYNSRHFHELLAVFHNNKNLAKIFKVAFILRLFYYMMVVYIPLYLHRYIGFDWATIGVIFTIMLIPFVIFEIPAGQLADKYLGEKEILVMGLMIMMVSTGAIFFIKSDSFVVWSSILFMTRVGASLVDAMQDVYFFKLVHKHDMDLINLFRDIRPAAWLGGSILAVLILQFFPIEYLFLFTAMVILVAVKPALTLQDTK